MRKFLKKNILEIFQTMYEVHKEIKNCINKKDYVNAQNLLADCQDTAIHIANLIEKSEGSDAVSITFIENYCLALYKTVNNFSENSNGRNIKKELDSFLYKAEKSVKNDIKVKLEIIVMPYKASMWDSLEGIWHSAALDSQNCNVHVIPIPYYDRNPDGSLGEMHYEGADFPKDVSILHYEQYDLEKMKPDVIYIHNPYDGNNFVTCIHPKFFSSNLKNYCEKLVYIPYFVLGEPNPNDEITLENISHFVLTPGVLNADEVIVQSEAMKQAYVNILLKHMGDTAENREYLNNKIKGTGSPKFEKIINTTKESITIPDEWNKYLYKADGSMKKVILYNNSVGALLENDEKMIKKIYSVLDTFYKNKDEVTLLWRPHPLIKATIASMRPHLWDSYNAIVQKYIADDWGIYDDTADLDRAIVMSDGYYGDWSSVVQLCQKKKMPIMIQNTEILEA